MRPTSTIDQSAILSTHGDTLPTRRPINESGVNLASRRSNHLSAYSEDVDYDRMTDYQKKKHFQKLKASAINPISKNHLRDNQQAIIRNPDKENQVFAYP
jgi:hypothetical protein